MKKKTQYSSVSEMVRATSDDPAFVEEFEKKIAAQQLIKELIILRMKAGLSQQDLAEKIKCTQSKISKLESSNDADVSFGDLVEYTRAVGHEMRLLLVPQQQKMMDDVKMYASLIRRLLGRLVQTAGKDVKTVTSIGRFLVEAAVNLTQLCEDAASEFSSIVERPSQPLHVESPKIEDDAAQQLRSNRKTKGRMMPASS